MQAKRIAKLLKDKGVKVKSFAEGDECEDGEVKITALISVQVPTYGQGLGVVQESADGESFKFYPTRRSLDALLQDLRKAAATVF